MTEIKGDILTVKAGYICHQVNTSGIMGAGLALSIRNKWPRVYKEYKDFCDSKKEKLGRVLIINVVLGVSVINLFGQSDIWKNKERRTRYDAVADAFKLLRDGTLSQEAYNENCCFDKLFVPKYMGCGLGGGDWDIYLSIILHYFPQVIIVDYELNKEIRLDDYNDKHFKYKDENIAKIYRNDMRYYKVIQEKRFMHNCAYIIDGQGYCDVTHEIAWKEFTDIQDAWSKFLI